MRETVAIVKARPSFEMAPALSFRLGASPDVLSSVEMPDVNLAVWRRWIASTHFRALRAWAEKPGAAFDAKIYPKTFDSSALTSSMPDSLASWLQKDIDSLLQLFSEFTGSERVRVQFHAVQSDQCRKYHIDNLRYRMITTYAGPGTEYVPETYVNRHALERSFGDHTSANRAIVRDERFVFRACPGDVLLMKGLGASPKMGAVHRSPPIEGTRARRVVLVLSTVGV